MNAQTIVIQDRELRMLLGAANGDTALLLLYLRGGNPPEKAQEDLRLPPERVSCALATLRQLGLWQPEEPARVPASMEKPVYTEGDVVEACDHDRDFGTLRGEVQRVLGRTMNTEELKILLGFHRYLGLPTEVVNLLVSYCRDQSRRRGNLRAVSLRTIEKEAYYWAEQGIDTVEEASVYIQLQNQRFSRTGRIMDILQIRGRRLTKAEERYAAKWIAAGFDDEAIAMAYERTCLNTGNLNWKYMDKILERWAGENLRTGAQIRAGDHKPTKPSGQRPLDEDEQAAIRRMMQEV